MKYVICGDSICWIEGISEEGVIWFVWCEVLWVYINCILFMGFFFFESYYVMYFSGMFYKCYLDVFKG